LSAGGAAGPHAPKHAPLDRSVARALTQHRAMAGKHARPVPRYAPATRMRAQPIALPCAGPRGPRARRLAAAARRSAAVGRPSPGSVARPARTTPRRALATVSCAPVTAPPVAGTPGRRAPSRAALAHRGAAARRPSPGSVARLAHTTPRRVLAATARAQCTVQLLHSPAGPHAPSRVALACNRAAAP